MSDDFEIGCPDRRLLVQADHDGELDVASSAALAVHVAGCADCAALRDRLSRLSTDLRAGMTAHAAPAALRARLTPAAALLASPTSQAALPRRAPPSPSTLSRRVPGRRAFASFAAGAAIAASLTLLMLPPQTDLDGELVGLHLRALQPGHLTDVVSSDQHTVKPWFDGRIDFAPVVKDLAAQGFPLIGGRLDALGGRPVAALVYARGKHVIDVVVTPEGAPTPATAMRQGYRILGWSSGGMSYRAISDLSASELDDFARLWRTAP